MALTKIEKRPKSRFSYADFCKNIWNMSQKDTLHYRDFVKLYDAELKALYSKSIRDKVWKLS